MVEQHGAQELLRFESQRAVFKVAEVVAGHALGDELDNAREFLAKSPEIGPRSETDFPQLEGLSEEQVAEIRGEAAKLGIGAEGSIGLKEAGLPEGTTVICEGGLPNKIMAQFKVAAEGETKPGTIILVGSTTRKLGASDTERAEQMSGVLGVETPDLSDKTEFDLTGIVAKMHPDFTPEEPTDVGIGFDVYDGGVAMGDGATGQVVKLGTIHGSTVVAVGIHEYHRDDSGKNFFRPGVGHLDELALAVATHFDAEAVDKPVTALTSHLYAPSRRLQNPNLLTYGMGVMAEVVGGENAEPTLPNVISEMDRVAEVLQQQAEL